MTKFLLIMLCLTLLFSCSVYAETNLDVSAMSDSELLSAYQLILSEINNRTSASQAKPSTNDGAITFRDLSWGINVDTFLTAMDSLHINKYSTYQSDFIGTWEMNYHNYYGGSLQYNSNIDIGKEITVYPENLTVAGYPVFVIQASFLYQYDDIGIHHNNSTTSMYSASYMFNVADVKAAYETLINKLSTLYGDAQLITGSDNAKYAVWYGADNTGVMLILADSDTLLQLNYGCTNSDSLFSEIKAAAAREEALNAMSDMSGL